MSWYYVQRTGAFFHGAKWIVTGYSGHGEGLNNPAMQEVHATGPLPVGIYAIAPARTSARLGPVTLDLLPDANNEMFGRSLFRIHGDNGKGDRSASDGCIILPRNVREFVDASPDKVLEVVAELSDLPKGSGA